MLTAFLLLIIEEDIMIHKLKILLWHNFVMNWIEGRVVKLDNFIWRNRWDKYRKDRRSHGNTKSTKEVS